MGEGKATLSFYSKSHIQVGRNGQQPHFCQDVVMLRQPGLLTRGEQGRAKLGQDSQVGPSNTKPSGELPCLRHAGGCWRPWGGDGCHSCPGDDGQLPTCLSCQWRGLSAPGLGGKCSFIPEDRREVGWLQARASLLHGVGCSMPPAMSR